MHSQAADAHIYREVFGCPVYFDQDWCGTHWPVSVVQRPLSSADYQTWELAERYLASQQAPNAATLSEDVTRLINTLLPTSQCSSGVIASQLSVHKRTLQRRLVREGTTFEQLLNVERLKLANQYLGEPNLKLNQIAGLLGYSEQSAFNRACQSWVGMTPRQYRVQLLSQQ